MRSSRIFAAEADGQARELLSTLRAKLERSPHRNSRQIIVHRELATGDFQVTLDGEVTHTIPFEWVEDSKWGEILRRLGWF